MAPTRPAGMDGVFLASSTPQAQSNIDSMAVATKHMSHISPNTKIGDALLAKTTRKPGEKTRTSLVQKYMTIDDVSAILLVLEIAESLGSYTHVPKRQAPAPAPTPKTLSHVGALPVAESEFTFRAKPLPKLEVAATPSSLKFDLLKMQKLAEDLNASGLDKVALTSSPKPTSTPRPQAHAGGTPKIPKSLSQTPSDDGIRQASSVNPIAAPIKQLDSGSHELRYSTRALPLSVCVRPHRNRDPQSSSAFKDSLLAWNVKIDFGGFGGVPLGCSLVSRWPRTNIFGRPDSLPSNSPVHTTPDLSLDAILGHFGSLATTPSKALPLKDNSFASPPSANQNPSSGTRPTSMLVSPANVDLDRSGTLASSPTALVDAGLASPANADSNRSSELAVIFPSSEAPSLIVDPEPSCAVAKSTDHFRLFDLPQELQDAIFGFAYTESGTKYKYKTEWSFRETRLRKTTGKPRADFPPHKVNEWMVSKRYFRAAVTAWMEAQTSLEFVKDHQMRVSESRFPAPTDLLGATGLFFEFGRTFVIHLTGSISREGSQQIALCRRMQHLIIVVDEDFFCETNHGYAWQVEFTDKVILESLRRANFSLPPGILDYTLFRHRILKYAKTEEQKAVFAANMSRLEHVMRKHTPAKPLADTAGHNHGALYLGSKVMMSPPVVVAVPTPFVKTKSRGYWVPSPGTTSGAMVYPGAD